MADINLQIVANADSAIRAIDRLETKLNELSTALGRVNTNGLSQLSSSVSEFSQAMGTIKSTSAKDFNKLANGFTRLSQVDTSKFGTISGDIGRLATSLQGFGNTNVDKSIVNLVNALTRLGQIDTSRLSATDFETFSQKLIALSNAMSQVGAIERNTISFVNAIAKLANAGQSTYAAARNLPILSQKLVDFFRTMQNAPAVSSEISQLVSAIAQLASAGNKVATTANNLSLLGEKIKELMTTLSTAPQVSQGTIQLVSSLSQLASSGGNASIGTNTLNTSLNRLPRSMNRVKRSTKGLVSAIGMFYAKCFLLIRAVKGIWSATEKAMDFVEVYHYFESAINEVARNADEKWSDMGYDSAEAYYNSFKERSLELTKKMTGYAVNENGSMESTGLKNLGINPTTLLNYQATFAQMATSMGVASEDALKLSNSLTMLGADLASIKNQDFEETWKNMASGMVGMSRAVDKYGINIRNAALQEKLNALGINATVSALSQSEKALLRTYIMVESSKYAWGDLATTLNSTKNQVRVLQASWESFCRTLGALFSAAVAKVIPYINVLLMALTRLFEYVAKLFGIEIPSTTSQATGGMDDLYDSIEDVDDAIGDANNSAKKLKGNLLGIDELNVINSQDDSGSGKLGGLGGIAGALSDALGDLLSDYDKVWDKAFNDLKDKINEWLEWLLDFFRRGDYYGLGKAIADWLTKALKKIDWDKIYKYAERFGRGLADFLNGLIQPELFYQLGRTMAGLLNTAFHFVGAFVERFDWKKAGLSLANMVNGFLDEIQPAYIAKTISNAIKGILDMAISFLKNTNWKKVGSSIMTFLTNIDWIGIAQRLWDLLVGAIASLGQIWQGAFDVNHIATLILSQIALSITLSKGALVFNALSKTLGDAANANIAANSLFSGLARAFQGMGGLGGLLTKNFMEITTASEVGLTLGGAVIGGIAAAFAGYAIGSAINEFFERSFNEAYGETDGAWLWHFINGGTEENKEKYQREATEQIKSASKVWNNAIESVADSLDWSGLFKFEGTDVWADSINGMDEFLKTIKAWGYNLSDTSIVMGLLEDNVTGLDNASLHMMQSLVQSYNALDDETKMALALQYGFTDLASTMSEAEFSQLQYKVECENAIRSHEKEIESISKTNSSLETEVRALKATKEAVAQYALEHSNGAADVERFNSSNENTIIALETKERAINATKAAVQQYADEQRKLHGINNDTVDGYSAFIDKLSESKVTADEFSKYMEVLADVDLPAVIESLGLFTDNLTILNDSMPNFKETFETTFKPFSILADETLPKTNEAFTTFRSTIATQMPLVEQSFTNAITNIQNKLEEIKNWYKDNIAIAFTEEYWAENLGSLETAFYETTKKICNGIIEVVNQMIDKINEGMTLELSSLTIGGKEVMTASTNKLLHFEHIEGFMNGGFPSKSNLFYANENGSSEFIGRIGGNPAVANNDQIVQAVSNGVYNAVMSAMSNNQSNVNVYLEGDAQGIFRVVREQNRQFTKQTGRNAFA